VGVVNGKTPTLVVTLCAVTTQLCLYSPQILLTHLSVLLYSQLSESDPPGLFSRTLNSASFHFRNRRHTTFHHHWAASVSMCVHVHVCVVCMWVYCVSVCVCVCVFVCGVCVCMHVSVCCVCVRVRVCVWCIYGILVCVCVRGMFLIVQLHSQPLPTHTPSQAREQDPYTRWRITLGPPSLTLWRGRCHHHRPCEGDGVTRGLHWSIITDSVKGAESPSSQGWSHQRITL